MASPVFALTSQSSGRYVVLMSNLEGGSAAETARAKTRSENQVRMPECMLTMSLSLVVVVVVRYQGWCGKGNKAECIYVLDVSSAKSARHVNRWQIRRRSIGSNVRLVSKRCLPILNAWEIPVRKWCLVRTVQRNHLVNLIFHTLTPTPVRRRKR